MDAKKLDDKEIIEAGGIKLAFMIIMNLAGLYVLISVPKGSEWLIASFMFFMNAFFAVEILNPHGTFSMKRQFIKINLGGFLGLTFFCQYEFIWKIFENSPDLIPPVEQVGVGILFMCICMGIYIVFMFWQMIKIGQYLLMKFPRLMYSGNPFRTLSSQTSFTPNMK